MSRRDQTEFFININSLVEGAHPYRKLDDVLCFRELAKPFAKIYSALGPKGRGAEFGLKVLVLQFMEDLSNREMARYLSENLAAKWFFELSLEQKTLDHSYFGGFRQRLRSQGLMTIFFQVRESLPTICLIREVFTFVNASQLVSKLTTWDNRDKAIKVGLDKFNNQTAVQVAANPQARFGCKGNNKFWYGYKEHASVDMQSGLVNKIAATTEAQGMKHVYPRSGAVSADKGYCVGPAKTTLKRNACHDATIKKNNRQARTKIKTVGSVLCAHRMIGCLHTGISTFAIKGLAKVQFQVGVRPLCFNLKWLITLCVERLELSPI